MKLKEHLLILVIGIIGLFSVIYISDKQKYVNIVIIILQIIILSVVWDLHNKFSKILVKK